MGGFPGIVQMPKLPHVKLFKQVKVNDKWILAPALFDSKSRVRRDRVLVAGKDELHAEGSYVIEKIAFENLPKFYVTANLYIPKNRRGPAPAVVYICFHAGHRYGSKVAISGMEFRSRRTAT